VYSNEDVTLSEAMDYMQKYNYLGRQNPDPQMQKLTDPSVVRRALMNLQAFGGVPVTGELDEPTKKLMKTPRCGNHDIENMASETRKKRYILEGSKWGKKTITYRIYTYTPDMPRSQVDSEIQRAFKVWSDVTPLIFRQIQSGTPDISITFATGSHGDGNPFDGPGGTLAHAFFPRFGGDCHFDDAELFSAYSRRGINLFQVAAHEFGHSLGLSHSRVQSALMAPFYRGYVQYFKLDRDDISGIQQLYGSPQSGNTPRPTPRPQPTPQPTQRPTWYPPQQTPSTPDNNPDYCTDGQFDDLVRVGQVTYGFRGDY